MARSLGFHARAHLGVVLGAAVGSAALIGALIVGDSVRGSLRDIALQRLGWMDAAMAPAERFFTRKLAEGLQSTNSFPLRTGRIAAALRLRGTATRQNGIARANQVSVLGIDDGFGFTNSALTRLPPRTVVINEALAAQLGARPGDEIVLRIPKPSALSRDVPVSPQSDSSVAVRVKVHAIAGAGEFGNFSLQANQMPPLNAFVRLDELAELAGLKGKANLLLTGETRANPVFQELRRLMTDRKSESLLRRAWLGVRNLFGASNGKSDPLISLTPEETVELCNQEVTQLASLADFGLDLRQLSQEQGFELRTDRIFLEPAMIEATRARRTNQWSSTFGSRRTTSAPEPLELANHEMRTILATNGSTILTYLVNQIRLGERSTPYSMVTAAGPPWTPAEMRDDEILVNQWLADDLQLKPGDTLEFTYFVADSVTRLVERTNRFRVRAIVPLAGPYADRTLMPDFPGLAKAESTHDWDAGFPLVHTIRPKDDQYWKDHRGTPKAFLTLQAGERMWGNRFGNATAVRWAVPKGYSPELVRVALEQNLRENLAPADFGLVFQPVRAEALAASSQGQDFGGLFVGFSFFLIIAAVILMALLFQFGLEQRATEVGTLLALGFTAKQVRRILLAEGAALAFLGGVVGVLGGMAYASVMLRGLTTVWRDAVRTSALQFHLRPSTLAIGLAGSVMVSAITIALVLRKQARQPARELLAEGAEERAGGFEQGKPKRGWARIIAATSGLAALGLVGWALWTRQTAAAGAFFGAGALCLIAGLGGTAVLLTAVGRSASARTMSITSLGLRGATRRRKRSLATVSLLACGTFLIVAIGAFKLDANKDAWKRNSGTGGFALIGQSTLPITQDLNSQAGREFFGLDAEPLRGVEVVPMRVRDGDDASCLNLNRAQAPRLLGVKPQWLQSRRAFTFAELAQGLSPADPWLLLQRRAGDDAVPAIGDENSIVWAMGKKIGDTLSLLDERGQSFKIRLVGGLANSILQGSLLIAEDEFVQKYPGESGYRMFLIDAPSNSVAAVSATLARSLQDVGLELTPAPQRLAAFNVVQNTYLNTFQVLGGLGLLLGSAGLGVVVLRNVWERRGELALLQAVGFRKRLLQWLVLSEHGGLLWLGLAVGTLAALVAILPALVAPGAEIHYLSQGAALAAVLINGLVWTWFATWLALRGELLQALRNE
jgi:putative ABC transport system permease protein